MKYKPTPFNLLGVLGVVWSVYSCLNSGNMGWGILAVITIFPISLFLLAFDLFIQFTSTLRVIYILELCILGFVLLFYYLF